MVGPERICTLGELPPRVKCVDSATRVHDLLRNALAVAHQILVEVVLVPVDVPKAQLPAPFVFVSGCDGSTSEAFNLFEQLLPPLVISAKEPAECYFPLEPLCNFSVVFAGFVDIFPVRRLQWVCPSLPVVVSIASIAATPMASITAAPLIVPIPLDTVPLATAPLFASAASLASGVGAVPPASAPRITCLVDGPWVILPCLLTPRLWLHWWRFAPLSKARGFLRLFFLVPHSLPLIWPGA